MRVSISIVQTHQRWVVVPWLVVGLAAQLALRLLSPVSLSATIESAGANQFYAVSQQYSAAELLSRFHELADTLPLHARANLPGKTLFFHALQKLTSSTRVMALLIIAISNLGGVLVYLLAKQWFQNPLTALHALVLYLFLPARLYFMPLMNTVSPVLMLLVFWLVTRSLAVRGPSGDGATTERRTSLFLAGLSLYAVVLFEPLPLAAFPLVAALIVKDLAARDLNWPDAAAIAVWVSGGFAAAFVAMLAGFGFNLATAFTFALMDAQAFNVLAQRPYSVWVLLNLRDFFLNMGLAQSLVFAALVVSIARRAIADPQSAWRQNHVVLTAAFLVVLVALDVLGINRGETVRLWIFLGVLMHMLVAHACAIWSHRRLFEPMLVVSIVQTAVCLTAVAWVLV